ncbi:hypothetical protein H8957_003410 [Semnopithecus entellus]
MAGSPAQKSEDTSDPEHLCSASPEFVLLEFSSDAEIQTMLFVLILVIHLLTLTGKLVMILEIGADSHLHRPMYFFLGHLSFLDLSYSYCKLPPFFPLSYTGPTVNEILLATSWAFWGLLTLSLTFFSYSRITSVILSICSSEGQGKAFSACPCHLTVVLSFYGTAFFRHPASTSGSVLGQVVCVQYSVITSLVNPLIYSLKNQEVKTALQRMLRPKEKEKKKRRKSMS